MPDIADISRETLTRLELLPPGAPVLAMVSGGADSTALLTLLASDWLGESQRPLQVLHVNHLLRGEESDADAEFVSAMCERLGVACRVVRFDVAAYADEAGLNLEDAGRRARYRFAEEELDMLCSANGVPRSQGRIATAHNRDDRVETFLMRTITGAGAGGFASIPYRRDRIVRPLLDCDRSAIRDWLSAAGVPWREDASNADTARLRSFVRHEIVPTFERANPAFRDTLSRSIDLLADDDALLTSMADAFARDFAQIAVGQRVEFDPQWMRTLDRVMARRTVRAALLTAFPEASRIEAFHVEALVAGLDDSTFCRDLPFGLRAQSEYGKLVVSRADEVAPVVTPSLLAVPGTVDLGPAGRMSARVVDPVDIVGTADSVTIDAGTADRFLVDSVRPGDRIRPFGMEGTRKVADLLVDEKVVRRQRGAVPIVRDGDRIVWVAGVRMAEEYRVGPSASRVVRLTWERTGLHDEASTEG